MLSELNIYAQALNQYTITSVKSTVRIVVVHYCLHHHTSPALDIIVKASE